MLYRGHLYRLAGLSAAPRSAAPKLDPKDKKLTDEDKKPVLEAWQPLTDKLLAQYEIRPNGPIVVTQEADGYDLIYSIDQVFNSPAFIRFDVSTAKKAIQEIQVRLMCSPPHSFVAAQPAHVKDLMMALKTISKCQKRSGTFTPLDENAAQKEAEDYVENTIMFLVNAGVEIDFTKQDDVVAALEKADLDEGEKAAAQAAVKQWDRDEYTAFVKLLQQQAGEIISVRESIYKKVAELTRHEAFAVSPETVRIEGYHNGAAVIGLDVPWPTVLELTGRGENLKLVNFATTICSVIVNSGPNENLAKALLTAQVDLILAGDRAANPSLSKPTTDKLNWTDEQVQEFLKTGVGLLAHRVDLKQPRNNDLTSVVVDNKVIESYEKGPENQIERNAKEYRASVQRQLNSRKPAYWFTYYENDNKVEVHATGNGKIVKTFQNIPHRFDYDLDKLPMETAQRPDQEKPQKKRSVRTRARQ
ncbi:MAG: hypothetical protein WC505_06780 [Patescibacteria group bacterium]